MPRVIRVHGLPLMVEHASEMMASLVRMRLIRYYRANPGSQSDAAAALDVPNSSLTKNIRVLLEAGVLIQEPSPHGGRAYSYRVDEDRVAELLDAANAYLLADEPADE